MHITGIWDEFSWSVVVRRIFQWIILISGIGLLLMTAMVAVVREDEPLEWMIYEDQDYVYWLHPDSGYERAAFASPDVYTTYNWSQYGDYFYFLLWTPPYSLPHLFRIDTNGRHLEPLSQDIIRGIDSFQFVDNKYLIAQTSEGYGPPDILRLKHDSPNIEWENLTNSPRMYDLLWSISADSEWLYFASETDHTTNEWEAFRTRIDGTDQAFMATLPENVTYVDRRSFVQGTPDDEWLWLTFIVDLSQQYSELYRLSTVDGTLEQLSDMSVDRTIGWSANKEWFVFTAVVGDQESIYRIRADGSNVQELTQQIDFEFSVPRLSTDENVIMLSSLPDGDNNADIFRIDIEDGNIVQLTHSDDDEYFADWSQDGKQFIYFTTILGAYGFEREFYITDLDAQNSIRLTQYEDVASVPRWSPDGKWLIFTAISDNDTHALFRVRSDGTERQQLVGNKKEIRFHTWSTTDVAWSKFQSFGIGLGLVISGLGLMFGLLLRK